MSDAVLVLEDGRAFRGHRFGARGDGMGEVVFNTAMTGYQEILADPSYAGQIVVMTYPQIGNYGIAPEDFESRGAFLAGFVVKEPSRIASNWRHRRTLDEYLDASGVPGLWGIDTRALVRHLRERGAMRGVLADPASASAQALAERARALPSMAGLELASGVTETAGYAWREATPPLSSTSAAAARGAGDGGRFRVVALDYGIKWNILRRLVDVGCDVTVRPATTSAEEILALRPDGVVLSNGPGDPEPVEYAIRTARDLLGRVPVFGICLGHQLLGLAAGGRTYKLKFGHHGGNHPVLDLATRKVEITSHNHGFALDPESLPAREVALTHVNLYDQTLEGLRLTRVPAFSVQFHPEAAPGPHDAASLFDHFTALMRVWREGGSMPAAAAGDGASAPARSV